MWDFWIKGFGKWKLQNVIAILYGVSRDNLLSIELKVMNLASDVETMDKDRLVKNRVIGELVTQVTNNYVALMDQKMQESERKKSWY